MITLFQESNLYYDSVGKENPIVLLHGFLESSSIWKSFINEFRNRRQIITIDLPGHSKSEVIEEEHSMELMAGAVLHVLQELKVEKADFLGHSMGGYVALAFLEKYPEMVEKFILLNSTPQADNDEKQDIRDRSITLVQKNKNAYISMAISNLLTPENNLKFNEQIEELKKVASLFPKEGISALLRGMKNRTDRTRVLKHFHGKKFILTGEQDPLLNYHEIEDIAEGTRSKLYAFPGGHLTYLENQNQFLNIVHFIR